MKKRIFLTLPALCFAAVAQAQDAGIFQYVFTQSYKNPADPPGRMQPIRAGVPVQVQLPAGPGVWVYDAGESSNVALTGEGSFDSPDRIAGTDTIQTFSFAVADGADRAKIVVTTDNLPPSLADIVPGGVFDLSLQVVSP
ncbi:MAG: hypothetical protein LJE68_15475 [Rhodobacter sp.]|nr:hypothetical protein [Rhodobacter sp.]